MRLLHIYLTKKTLWHFYQPTHDDAQRESFGNDLNAMKRMNHSLKLFTNHIFCSLWNVCVLWQTYDGLIAVLHIGAVGGLYFAYPIFIKSW